MTFGGEGAVGISRLPLKRAFVFTVLELLAAGSNALRVKKTVTPDMAEDKISQRLDQEMEVLHRGSESDIVTWALRPAARIAPGKPDEITEVDFRFHWNQLPRDQRLFLAVEAKRLRGTGTSLAGPYVEEGVLRFVTGRYAPGHDYAVMMGYVTVRPVAGAISKVKDAMERRKAEAKQLSGMTPEAALSGKALTCTSSHLQKASANSLIIVHLFLDLGPPLG